MLYTTQLDQAVFRVGMLNAVRTPMLCDGDEFNGLIIPALAEFPSDGSLNQIYLSNWEAATPIRWSSTLDNNLGNCEVTVMNCVQPAWPYQEYSAHDGRL